MSAEHKNRQAPNATYTEHSHESLSKADRRWIRRLIELTQDERAWVDVEENVRVLAKATLRRLSGLVN